MNSAPLTLSALVARNLETRPDAPAFIEGDNVITYAEFDSLVGKTAGWLQRRGIGPGDLVAVWLVNRIEWLSLFFALGRIGATLVAVNTRFRSAEVERILDLSGAKMLVLQLNFHSIDFPGVLAGVNEARLPNLTQVALIDAASGGPERILGKPTVLFDAFQSDEVVVADGASPDTPLMLFTTSGTTRGPKLVVHPHRTMVAHARGGAESFGFDQRDAKLLAVMPFCGAFGSAAILAAFAGGAPAVLMDAFVAERAVELIRRHRITHVYGSDELFRRVLDLAPGHDPFPSARVFAFGAFSPGAMEFAQSACARRVPMFGAYGSSEVLGVFSMQPTGLPPPERVMCGGLPAVREAEVRVRDVESKELLPAGRSGELEIRSPTLFLEYLNNPDATAEAFRPDGFFRTGDIGKLRPDGTFVFEVRSGDAIRLGGFLVDPTEIEDALKNAAGIAEAHVVAIEMEGKVRCVAFAVPSPGSTPTEAHIIETAMRTIAPFKVPARVWFVEDVPTTPSANGTKVQKAKLREMAAERLLAERSR